MLIDEQVHDTIIVTPTLIIRASTQNRSRFLIEWNRARHHRSASPANICLTFLEQRDSSPGIANLTRTFYLGHKCQATFKQTRDRPFLVISAMAGMTHFIFCICFGSGLIVGSY